MFDTNQSMVSLSQLNELYQEISQYRGALKLRVHYSEDQQIALQNQLVDALANEAESVDVQKVIASISLHLCLYGDNDEIQSNAFDTLLLVRDSKQGAQTESIQKLIYTMIYRLSTSDNLNHQSIAVLAQKELYYFLSSPFDLLRKKVTLYFLDVKSNPDHNVLTWRHDEMLSEMVIKTFVDNLVVLILEGPRSYSCIQPEHGTISSDDILVKFLNQFVYGHFGLGNRQWSSNFKAFIQEKLVRLSTSTDTDYLNHVATSMIKALLKRASTLENQIKGCLTQSHQDDEKKLVLLSEAEAICDLLTLMSNEKLNKTIIKNRQALSALIAQLNVS